MDKGRQHRHGPAEQHRKHIQRLCTEYDLIAEHKAQAFADAGKNRRALRRDGSATRNDNSASVATRHKPVAVW